MLSGVANYLLRIANLATVASLSQELTIYCGLSLRPSPRHKKNGEQPNPRGARSSRAISDACKLGGTATAGDEASEIACAAAASLPASKTALVISSTNSGMPSVRSMMSWRTLAASSLLPTTWSITASISRCVSRLSVTALT